MILPALAILFRLSEGHQHHDGTERILDEEVLLSSLQSALRDWHNSDRPLSLPASDH